MRHRLLILFLAFCAANPTLLAEATLTVQGRVLDEDLRPVANALVTVRPVNVVDGFVNDRVGSAETGDDGEFRVELDWGAANVRVRVQSGAKNAVLDRVAVNRSPQEVGVIFVVSPTTLQGEVVDENGDGLAGAVVRVTTPLDVDGDGWLGARTSDAGRFTMPGLPRCPVDIAVTKEGFADRVRKGLNLNGPDLKPIRFTLRTERSVEGTIQDEAGAAVVGARVELKATPGEDEVTFHRSPVITDAAGRFRLRGIASDANDLRVTVRSLDFPERELGVEEIAPDRPIVLARGPMVRLRPESDADAVAFALVNVEVYEKGEDGWKREESRIDPTTARIDDDGAWTFAVRPGDVARMSALSIAGQPTRVDDLNLRQISSGALEAVARFSLSQSISGRVLGPLENPLGDVRIELGQIDRNAGLVIDKALRTDADGSFRFTGLSPGSYALRALTEDGLSAPVPAALTAGRTVEGMPVMIEPASSIRGRLTHADRQLPVLIRALRYDRSRRKDPWTVYATTRAGDDGAFEFPVVSAGRFAIVPVRPPEPEDGAYRDFGAEKPSMDYRQWPWLAEMTAGESADVEIDWIVPKRSWLHGTLRVNGEPRAGLTVSLSSRSLGSNLRSATTDENGTFRFRMEGGGDDFELLVLGETLRARRPIAITAGDDVDASFDLTVGRVRGVLVPEDPGCEQLRVQLETEMSAEEFEEKVSKPVKGDESPWQVFAQTLALPDSEPPFAFEFDQVVKGRYRVAALDVQQVMATVATDPFDLEEPGGTVDVGAIELPFAAAMTVSLRETTGEKLPFASIQVRSVPPAAPLAKTFVGWFVEGEATVTGLPPGRMEVELHVYDKRYEPRARQEVELEAFAPPAGVRFDIAPKPDDGDDG